MPKATSVNRLENGLRYVVLPTTRSSNEVSLRVRVNAGVAQENGDNPTARIAALETIQGTNWTVTTDYQQTVFSLDLGSASVDDIDVALRTLYVGLNRKAQQHNPDTMLELAQQSLTDIEELLSQRHLDSLVAESTFATLDKDSFEQTSLDSIEAFKQAYFTPNNTSIIVVGGIQKRATIKTIERQYSLWNTYSEAVAKRPLPEFKLADSHTITTPVTMSSVSNFRDDTDSKLQRKEILMATLANKMLEQRIQNALSKQHLQAKVDVDNQVLFDHRLLSQIRIADLNETEKQEAEKVVKTEIQRALASGFSRTEYEMVVSQVRKQLEQQTRLKNPEAYTRNQADRLVNAIDNGTVYTAPSYDLDLLNFHVAHLNEFDISKEFENVWSGSTSVIM
ncbi:insulinase family protein [Vibrio sp. TBV020]|uniref:insulinase family protein n=1 Tax=Vibrio sp. TBV020 TaxID=3137398 RepID=UPI0038CD326F